MNFETENIGPAFRDTDARTFRFWFRQFLVGNPFYIVSAALLLYGIYCISMDPRFDDHETRQLMFNFGSLQVYGILLTITALFLVRRRIWYDSTLLVVLECALVLVPFILVSQAVSLSKGMAYLMCGLTTFLAAVNFSLLKKYHPNLNLPPMLLCFGAVMPAINGVLPLMFKSMQETGDAAMTLDVQEATVRFAMTGILPALAVLAVFLPHYGGNNELPSQKSWLPMLIHLLWVTATGVHFYSIQYVYEAPFHTGFFVPAAWALAWLVAHRMKGYLPPDAVKWRTGFQVLPAVIALPVLWPGETELSAYFLACNVAIYGVLCFRDRFNRVALHLALLSLAGVVAEMHREFWPAGWAGFNSATWLFICAIGYVVLAAMFSRSPKLGLPAAACVAWATALWLRHSDIGPAVAIQAGLGFALLHSILWKDGEIAGAKAVRTILAGCWLVHSLWWAQSHAQFSLLVPAMIAVALLTGFLVAAWVNNVWPAWVLLIAPTAVLVSIPAGFLIEKVKTTSPGVLAVAGSFVLFAVGTWFALAKSKWFDHPPGDVMDDEIAPECRHD